jgi:phospholipid/cholesterol/gamma-HCH transport system substrate-binding protein
MKISNETKVGSLTAIAITLLVLGFNFLKGRSLLKTGNFLYAKYTDVKGIMPSNPVYANGFQIGSVYDVENENGNDLNNIIVTIKLKTTYNIPDNSIAAINSNPLGSPSLAIHLGNSKKMLTSGDTLVSKNDAGLFDQITQTLNPVLDQLKTTFHSLDSALKNINSIFDPTTKNNLQQTFANVNKITQSLGESTVLLNAMLNKETGSIASSMNNLDSFTKNLANNNNRITGILTNLDNTTANLSKTDINGAVDKLKNAVDSFNAVITKVNSDKGTLGALMNDKTLYNNLTNTVRSANILLDDLRTHPKRYVNISVFGKKDKSEPLSAPLSDSAQKK